MPLVQVESNGEKPKNTDILLDSSEKRITSNHYIFYGDYLFSLPIQSIVKDVSKEHTSQINTLINKCPEKEVFKAAIGAGVNHFKFVFDEQFDKEELTKVLELAYRFPVFCEFTFLINKESEKNDLIEFIQERFTSPKILFNFLLVEGGNVTKILKYKKHKFPSMNFVEELKHILKQEYSINAELEFLEKSTAPNLHFLVQGKKKYFLKIHSDDEFVDEKYLEKLFKHLKSRLFVLPQKTNKKKPYTFFRNNKITLFPFVENERPSHIHDKELIKSLALFHKLGNSFEYGKDSIILQTKFLNNIKFMKTFFNSNKEALEIITWIRKKKFKKLTQGHLHTDFSPKNLLFKDNEIHKIIDLDNCTYGPLSYDIAKTICSLSLEKADKLITYYTEEKKLLKKDIEAIKMFIIYHLLFDLRKHSNKETSLFKKDFNHTINVFKRFKRS